MPNSGLLVVRHIDYASNKKYNAGKLKSSIGLSSEEILTKYKGIEGEAWPNQEKFMELRPIKGLIPAERFGVVHNYMKALNHNESLFLLFVVVGGGVVDNILLPSTFYFCGYDVGVYESEYNYFSSIYNDLIYGKHDLLTALSPSLNENLLFPDLNTAVDFANRRNLLLQKGYDLESIEEGEWFGPIPVWHWKDVD